ncbi:GSCFA domain-containing protein [Christiangramia aquimixticola]|uniref:GSCFA domain-containing protein n=1 Tax=Christiangramia aquimixticola TaxID=1697558 RepID=UPI003AA93933
MEFRTKVPVSKSRNLITHSSGLVLLGSCFVENIGEKLQWFKFKPLQNPFGIIFHSNPLLRLIERLVNNQMFDENDLIHFEGNWLSLEAHSVMNAESKEKVLENLNSALKESRNSIIEAEYVIISLGSAWAYEYVANNKKVANCHRIPQKQFKKVLSSGSEIAEDLQSIRQALNKINKDLKIICTVSPVRHLKDGFVGNQRGKSNLISGVHDFIEEGKNAFYFPSYEIMMDELRDYRFYKDDMIHPGELAINYIWEQFSENWMSDETLNLNLKIDKIQKALAHRPRAENSDEHKKFLTKIYAKIEEIHKKHPEITFS